MRKAVRTLVALGGPKLDRTGLLGLWDENGISYIGESIGPVQPGRGYTGDGTAYITITGLLTTDTITADSTDVPACTVDDRLDIANGDLVYGVTIKRGGETIGHYPCAEGAGTVAYNTFTGPAALPSGTITDESIHTDLVDGTGFDLNQDGFSDHYNLHKNSDPRNGGAWNFFEGANEVVGDEWTQFDIHTSSVYCLLGASIPFTYVEGVTHYVSFSAKCLPGQSAIVKFADNSGYTLPVSENFTLTDQEQRFTAARNLVSIAVNQTMVPTFKSVYGATTILVKNVQNTTEENVPFVPTVGTAKPKIEAPTISTERSLFSGKIVFFGDSITLNYANKMSVIMAHSPTIVNSGFGGETVVGAVARVQTAVLDHSPDICVIGFGINDLVGDPNMATLQASFQQILSAISGAGITPIILTVSPWKNNGSWTSGRQENTDIWNAWIKTLGYQVIDTYSFLEDPNEPDTLQWRFSYTDWLHYSTAGYNAVGKYIDSQLPVGTSLIASDARGDDLLYPGPLKYSLTNPSEGVYKWPSAPALIAILGVDNAVYDATGDGVEFATEALAIAAMESLDDDTYVFTGRRGTAVYSVDSSAIADRINRALGT